MPTLGSAIVKRGVASMSDVEEGLARQTLHGGDLVTNLLEVTGVDESLLAETLAEVYGLASAGSGELPRSSDRVLGLVPRDLAQRHGIYPLDANADGLLLAVCEPIPSEVEEDLSFALGLRVEQRTAPLVRIRQAIARDYGVPLERRMLRLLARLEGRPDPSPSLVPPPAAPITDTARPHTEDPGSVPEPASAADLAPQPSQTDTQTERGASPAASSQTGPSRPPSLRLPPRRGPYPTSEAESDLATATSRDQVVRAFFDFASQYFEYSALFAIHGDLAEGREARGPGAGRSQIRSIGVPLDLPSTLQEVRNEGQWKLVKLTRAGLDTDLAKDLRRKGDRKVLLFPVLVKKRCVLILYGDHGSSNVELSQIGDVIALGPLVSRALERIILQRKGAVLKSLAAPGSPRSGVLFGGPELPNARGHGAAAQPASREQRAEALAHALEPPQIPRFGPQTTEPTPGVRSEPLRAMPEAGPRPPEKDAALPPPNERPVSVVTAPTVPIGEATPTPHPDATPLIPETELDEILEMARSSEPDLPPVFPLTRRSLPAASDSDTQVPSDNGWDAVADGGDFPVEERMTSPGIGVRTEIRRPTPPAVPPPPPRRPKTPPPKKTSAAPSTDDEGSKEQAQDQAVAGTGARVQDDAADGPSISVATEDVDAGWALEHLDEDGEESAAPESQVLSFSARAPKAPHEAATEMALPTFIVDVARDCRALVHELIGGAANAETQMLEIGDAAISALMERFPGPISEPGPADADGAATPASRRGPILRALVRFGPASIGPLTKRAADPDADHREWALRLLGEIPSADSARAMIPRLLDDNRALRRAALDAAQMLMADADARRTLQQRLSETAAYEAQSIEVRTRAVRALADLRETQAIPALSRVLEQAPAQVAQEAKRALCILTRQDFGDDPRRWREWWKRNHGRHRIEWLIDALTHDQAGIRLAAGEELKTLTKTYFGYYDDLPRKERARAQKRYRHWWDTQGKTRFR